MMVSAWHLEPYSEAYLDNVLTDLARHQTAGIVYGTLGATNVLLRERQAGIDEAGLNRQIYTKARQFGTRIGLQMRLYDNRLAIDSVAGRRNLTAEEIISKPAALAAFRTELTKDVDLYNEYFRQACVVIVFEEAGIYHSPEGGGTFWSSSPNRILRPNRRDDDLFGERMSALFGAAFRTIKSINPLCSVGMHLGHSAMEDQPVLKRWFERLDDSDTRPDFVLYDLYLKAQPDFEHYARLLGERSAFVKGELGTPVLHLAQLHTMNTFQHGLGATPSQSEIDAMVALDERLGVSGIGFYTKNALATARFENGPLNPNTVGQATVYESSKDRWDYGLLKLFETSGVHFEDLFDVVVRPRGSATQTLSIRNLKTGDWDLIGALGGSGGPGGEADLPLVFRALGAGAYMRDREQVVVHLAGGAGGGAMWVIPSEPATKFRSAASLMAEISASGHPAGSSAAAEVAAGGNATLCIQ